MKVVEELHVENESLTDTPPSVTSDMAPEKDSL